MKTTTIRTDSIRHALADIRATVNASRDEHGHGVGHSAPAPFSLDDGSRVRVGLAPSSDGGQLMGVYEARREMLDGEVRVYTI